ncbi:hypothetical protein GA0061070_101460 [Kosakonia oryziphila]|jgi:hypothetical protein|uniref:Uncharacterized protein n=1 Tax=Kosakonia oryziphila TaxID=1005667 RepID=A0A1C4D3E6_9ENTR|nr:hypothetical protein GA0061070_101460 [Kosakonia oryziphila]
MKTGLFVLMFIAFFSSVAHADCNPRKVARHAAMQATVGV